MNIRQVELQDRDFWMGIDKHVDPEGFQNRVRAKTGYVMWEQNLPVGLMWHCVLWDNLPFLNLIFVVPEHRGKGYGTQAMAQWEQKMKKRGFRMVLVSTQVDESAQALYRKLGYVDCGGLVFEGTPFQQPMELFLRKIIQ